MQMLECLETRQCKCLNLFHIVQISKSDPGKAAALSTEVSCTPSLTASYLVVLHRSACDAWKCHQEAAGLPACNSEGDAISVHPKLLSIPNCSSEAPTSLT